MENREIKFRVFLPTRPDEPSAYRYYDLSKHEDIRRLAQDIAVYPTSILQQFTGLKDKNGKEIYEGDLMIWENVKRADGKPFTIEFSTELYGEQYGGGEDYFSGFSFPSLAEYGEVVGNIYENPELLSKLKDNK